MGYENFFKFRYPKRYFQKEPTILFKCKIKFINIYNKLRSAYQDLTSTILPPSELNEKDFQHTTGISAAFPLSILRGKVCH